MAKGVYTAVTNMSALECNEAALAMISFFFITRLISHNKSVYHECCLVCN